MANGTVPKTLDGRPHDKLCDSCAEHLPNGECEKSQMACGHHCNCSWEQCECCWCHQLFGEVPNTSIPGNLERVLSDFQQMYRTEEIAASRAGDHERAEAYRHHAAKLARGEYPPDWE